MKLRYLITLYLISVGILLFIAFLKSNPGYMDADYYCAAAQQIYSTKQFVEPFLWNYLSDPIGIPTPSFTYWMPLTALISTAGMTLIGQNSFFAARILLILIAGLISPFTTILSYELDQNRFNAIWAGILALLPGYYLVFLSTTDSFGVSMILGGACLFLISRYAKERANIYAVLFGLLSGLMHLARADGILWLIVGIFSFAYIGYQSKLPTVKNLLKLGLICGGYVLIMSPWYLRNIQIFDQLMPPGSSKTLWLTNYDELFRYPSSEINVNHWLDSGLKEIINARVWALTRNIQNIIGVQGIIVLLPFMMIGLWKYRSKWLVKAAVIYWILLFTILTFIFPFPGARGSFFHSGSSIQILLWAVVPGGFNSMVVFGAKHRGWNVEKAKRFFIVGITGLVLLITIFVSITRLSEGLLTQRGDTYQSVFNYLQDIEGDGNYLVMVNNPPEYYLSTNMTSIVIPDNLDSMFIAASHYGANYLILEPNANFPELYSGVISVPGLELIQVIDDVNIYKIFP